jgi:ATP-dependent RNA helicase DDX19/DBP5
MEFAEGIVSNPVVIRLKREEESLHNIKQYYVMCRNLEDKYTAIANIYGVVTIGQAMIFCHVSCSAASSRKKTQNMVVYFLFHSLRLRI